MGVRWHTIPLNPNPRRRPSFDDLLPARYGNDPTFRTGEFFPSIRRREPRNGQRA